MKVEGILQNKAGFHLRPAQLFMEKANEFQSEITVRNEDGMEADGKSILGLMTMGFEFGSKIIIETSGDDAELAANSLLALVNGKFGEE